MNLAPDLPFGTAMFAGVPFALALDPGAIDQEVQRTFRAAVWDEKRPRFSDGSTAC